MASRGGSPKRFQTPVHTPRFFKRTAVNAKMTSNWITLASANAFDIGSWYELLPHSFVFFFCFFDRSIGLLTIALLVNQPYVVLLEYKIYKFKEEVGERCFSVHRWPYSQNSNKYWCLKLWIHGCSYLSLWRGAEGFPIQLAYLAMYIWTIHQTRKKKEGKINGGSSIGGP